MEIEFKITLAFVAVGALVGILSNFMSNNIIALLVALIILFASKIGVQTAFKLQPTEEGKIKKYDAKWWLSHGAYPYMIFWLFIWILLYNL